MSYILSFENDQENSCYLNIEQYILRFLHMSVITFLEFVVYMLEHSEDRTSLFVL